MEELQLYSSAADAANAHQLEDQLEVLPAFPEDFARVRSLFSQLNPRVRAEQWKNIFEYPWRPAGEPVGFIALARGAVIGFLGTTLSDQVVAGKRERFCHLTTWVTQPAYRGAGALLMLQLRNLMDYSITNLSPNSQGFAACRRLGFEVLERETVTLALDWSTFLLARTISCEIVNGARLVRPLLSGNDAQLLDDHAYCAHHMLVVARDTCCYLIYSMRSRRLRRWARLHYIGDKQLFAECYPCIQRSLFRTHGATAIQVDGRMLSGIELQRAITHQLELPRLFRSRTMRAEQVTELYSEAVLIGID